MKIGMITSAPFPPREGIGFYIWNLSRYLTRQGHQVHIITRGSAHPTKQEVVDGITIWRPFFVPLYPFHVHLHSLFVGRLLRRLSGDLDILHLHTPLVKTPKTNLPTLVTVHTPMKADVGAIPVTDLYSLMINLQAPVSTQLEKEIFKKADQLSAVASSVAAEMGEYGIDPKKVAVMGNGVDTDIFYPAPVQQESIPPYLLTAGRLGPRKGLQDLIHCAEIVIRDHPEVQFRIAGEGPLRESLVREIANRRLENQVRLLGHIADRKTMVDLYRGALAYLHPAHYEGLPTVLIEAMACGRPVVATAVSGALDVVQDGVNGLLVPSRDPDHMAEALQKILQDSDWAEELGVAALQTVETRYAWRVVSRSYLALYEELLAKDHSD